MTLDIRQFEAFRKKESANNGAILNVSKTIKEVLLKVRKALNEKGQLSHEIDYDMKSILTRAYMLDKVFNPLYGDDEPSDWAMNMDLTGIDWSRFGIAYDAGTEMVNNTPDIEKPENLVYYHTPAIGVFYQGTPIFLNSNYIEALGAQNESQLKEDIVNGIALEKYYLEECVEFAKEAVKMLSDGQGYRNLVLITKHIDEKGNIVPGKRISWNSFGNKDGLEIRIGNDITEGTFKTTQTFNKDYEGLDLNTSALVKGFLVKITSIIGTDMEITNKLIMFGILGTIIDKIWNSGQFLMNVTINDEIETAMLFNSRYADALRRSREEILTKIEKGVLWKETYDEQTLTLINGLLTILQDEGYYISEFPLKDKNGKSSIYSWLRFLIKDDDFYISRTFGIGTNAISKDMAELQKLMKGMQ